MLLVSACGIFDCETCVHRTRSRCVGCSQGNALIAAHGERQCAVFQCAKTHGITSCRDCTEVVCPFTRSPEMACPVRSRYEKQRCYARKISEHFLSEHPVRQEVTLVAKKLDKVIARLPWYLFAMHDFMTHGVIRVSSEDIARKVGVKSWVVRRDLSQFGEFGRASLGYETAKLRECLSDILHLNVERKVAWVGAARLDADKSLISRFREHKFNIVAVFDADVSRVPEMIGGVKVTSIEDMPRTVAELGVECGIIATAHDEAQGVADTLISAGIRGILNLTSTAICCPEQVCVKNVDVAAELFALSYYCSQVHGSAADEEELEPAAT